MQSTEPVLRFNPAVGVSHPLGVKPSGNLYLCDNIQEAVEGRSRSLGPHLGSVSEELLIELLSFCGWEDLVTLTGVSKYTLAFSFHPDLWRDLFWSEFGSMNRDTHFALKSSWRTTFLDTKRTKDERTLKKQRTDDAQHEDNESGETGYPRVPSVFSDLLYGPYRASGLRPTREWIQRENIDRVSIADMSVARFIDEYESRNRPVIVTDFVTSEWTNATTQMDTVEKFAQWVETNLGDPVMECGAQGLRMSEFRQYLANGLSTIDESPYFVFDTRTFQKCEKMAKFFTPRIPLFDHDLFDLLSGEYRPDNAWLLIGSPGASSKWHVDPNATNAWNGVISGEKKWVLLPPHLGPPPGVEVSSDGFAVRQPLTLTDWIDGGFYADLYRQFHGKGLVEATCRAGEIMFVPRGWWHCVRNTGESPTIAVTQNYVAESSVDQVRRFLKEFSHCVSGVPVGIRSKLWVEFDRVLRIARPDLVRDIDIPDVATSVDDDGVADKDDDDNESCCGGEVQEFSFWDHFNTSTKSLSFHR